MVYDKEEIKKELYKLYLNLKRCPTNKEIDSCKELPCNIIIRKLFGTIRNAWFECGVPEDELKTKFNYKGPEKLIKELIELSNILNRTPTMEDINSKKYPWMSNHSVYVYHFGSWNNALIKAGLSINRSINISDNELIIHLKLLHTSLNRVPKVEDMGNSNHNYSSGVYVNRFGSWNNALIKAGLDLNRPTYSDAALINNVISLYQTNNDIKILDINSSKIGSPTTYQRRFINWNNLLEDLDIPIHRSYGTVINIKNERFHSIFEYRCFKYLNDRKIQFLRQKPYIKNRKLTCDFFLIDYNYWLEVSLFNNNFLHYNKYIKTINFKENYIRLSTNDNFKFISSFNELEVFIDGLIL